MTSMSRLLPVIVFALAAACGGDSAKSSPQASGPSPDEGLVREVIQSGGYTFLRTVRLGKEVWVRAPETNVAAGDRIAMPEGMPQNDFTAESLGRKFDLIYLVSGISVMGGSGAPTMPMPSDPHGGATMPAGHPVLPEGHPPTAEGGTGEMGGMGMGGMGGAVDDNPNKSRPPVAQIDLAGIAKADNGNTIAELYAARGDLKDKDVVVRARVVKFTPQVMQRNWVHVRDGSGAEGTNDLTFTTTGQVEVGATVLVKGKLTVDRDFGFGYRYDVIIEDAEFTVEK